MITTTDLWKEAWNILYSVQLEREQQEADGKSSPEEGRPEPSIGDIVDSCNPGNQWGPAIWWRGISSSQVIELAQLEVFEDGSDDAKDSSRNKVAPLSHSGRRRVSLAPPSAGGVIETPLVRPRLGASDRRSSITSQMQPTPCFPLSTQMAWGTSQHAYGYDDASPGVDSEPTPTQDPETPPVAMSALHPSSERVAASFAQAPPAGGFRAVTTNEALSSFGLTQNTALERIGSAQQHALGVQRAQLDLAEAALKNDEIYIAGAGEQEPLHASTAASHNPVRTGLSSSDVSVMGVASWIWRLVVATTSTTS
jgi:hypothetical protein